MKAKAYSSFCLNIDDVDFGDSEYSQMQCSFYKKLHVPGTITKGYTFKIDKLGNPINDKPGDGERQLCRLN